MNATLTPARLTGRIPAIPSKSDAHRVLICAALGDKPVSFSLPATSADIEATIACLQALGSKIEMTGGTCAVTPIGTPTPSPVLDCGESGSTLRFLLPVAAALGCDATFLGHGRLPERPIGELLTTLATHGVTATAPALPLTLHGTLTGGEFALPGDISSQYITGLLLAMPLLPDPARIRLTSPLQSAGYVDMTARTMARFGVPVTASADGFATAGLPYRTPDTLTVEGDWSGAAFWLAAGALSGPVTVTGLATDSAQGDRGMLPILEAFGAEITQTNEEITVSPAPLTAQEIDMSEIPDLLPPLAVVAAGAVGTTRLYNAGRCRIKECDRIHAMAALLTALGGQVEERAEELIIHGTGRLLGGTVEGMNDHRIVMAAALAATLCREPVTVTDREAVAKSYPAFFEDYQQLGGALCNPNSDTI